jgi:hypothetical protein
MEKRKLSIISENLEKLKELYTELKKRKLEDEILTETSSDNPFDIESFGKELTEFQSKVSLDIKESKRAAELIYIFLNTKDILMQSIIRLSAPDLMNLCQINNDLKKFCMNQTNGLLWRLLFLLDIGFNIFSLDHNPYKENEYHLERLTTNKAKKLGKFIEDNDLPIDTEYTKAILFPQLKNGKLHIPKNWLYIKSFKNINRHLIANEKQDLIEKIIELRQYYDKNQYTTINNVFVKRQDIFKTDLQEEGFINSETIKTFPNWKNLYTSYVKFMFFSAINGCILVDLYKSGDENKGKFYLSDWNTKTNIGENDIRQLPIETIQFTKSMVNRSNIKDFSSKIKHTNIDQTEYEPGEYVKFVEKYEKHIVLPLVNSKSRSSVLGQPNLIIEGNEVMEFYFSPCLYTNITNIGTYDSKNDSKNNRLFLWFTEKPYNFKVWDSIQNYRGLLTAEFVNETNYEYVYNMKSELTILELDEIDLILKFHWKTNIYYRSQSWDQPPGFPNNLNEYNLNDINVNGYIIYASYDPRFTIEGVILKRKALGLNKDPFSILSRELFDSENRDLYMKINYDSTNRHVSHFRLNERVQKKGNIRKYIIGNKVTYCYERDDNTLCEHYFKRSELLKCDGSIEDYCPKCLKH